MADILIRKVDDGVKERLVQKAAEIGSSLEAFLRDVLSREAHVSRSNDDKVPFGSWAVSIFADLHQKYPGLGDEFADILDRLELEDTPPSDGDIFEA